MTLSLLVATPGSKLTHIAKAVGQQRDVLVLDIEEHLKENLLPEDVRSIRTIPGQDIIDMSRVCESFTRDKVLELWRNSAASCAQTARQAHGTSHRDVVIACHLTLFRSDRSEYYSTIAVLTQLLNGTHDTAAAESVHQPPIAPDVDNVVLLIDDIYDMYVRLSGPTGVLSTKERLGRWRAFTDKSTAGTVDLGGSVHDNQLKLETTLQTLSQLISWRRQESLFAESLALAIHARFSVLGIKHSTATLLELLTSPAGAVRTIYISHPISAYRRDVNRQIQSGVDPSRVCWSPEVSECNRIPEILAHDQSLIGIMPTAIDELRFRGLHKDAHTITERIPQLGPRWPLMNAGDDLLASVGESADISDESVQHTDLLIPSGCLPSDIWTGALTRHLESLIFNEIPYRDHLLVANSDALFVFRPLADRGRLSSGVEHEVVHWVDKVKGGDSETRLLVLHTAQDLLTLNKKWTGQAEWLSPEDNSTRVRITAKSIQTFAKKWLQDNFDLDDEQTDSVLAGIPLDLEHLGGHRELSGEAPVCIARARALVHGVDSFFKRELSIIKSEFDSPQARIAIVDPGVSLTPTRAADLRRFLDNREEAPVSHRITTIRDEHNQYGEYVINSAAIQKVVFDDASVFGEKYAQDADNLLESAFPASSPHSPSAASGALQWVETLLLSRRTR